MMDRVKEWVQEHWQWVFGALAIGGLLLWQLKQPVAPAAPSENTSQFSSSSSAVSSPSAASSNAAQAGYVDIKGAVKNPGLYPVNGKTRWMAVVTAAGGLTAAADVSQLNLAKIASDQESLYVPKKGETPPAAGTTNISGAAGATATSESGAVVNLNNATETELQTLSGVGPKKAADIIAYREEHGGFKTIDELKEVSGIGEKTFAKLAPNVTVGP